MRIRIEPNSGVPLGQQIMQQVRLAIASGRLQPGEQLPSARDLAAELRVNFHTVRKAYADLEGEGVLRFERGKGTFVPEQVTRLDPAKLRELVREHVQRLAADLAGSGVSGKQVEEMILAEVRALFAGEPARCTANRRSPSQEG
jgi:GntR family transcriptional regulator